MFGWRKTKFGHTEEQLREAYRKRLAEVLGVHENEFAASEASQQTPSSRSVEMNAEPEFSHTC